MPEAKFTPVKAVPLREDLAKLTEHPARAAILQQFLYWSERVSDYDAFLAEEEKPGENKLPYRHGWIYKSSAELSEELFGLWTGSTIRRHLSKIVEAGWVDRRDSRNSWDNTKQYRVSLSKIREDLQKKGIESPLRRSSQPLVQDSQPVVQNAQSIEQSAETVPESTNRDDDDDDGADAPTSPPSSSTSSSEESEVSAERCWEVLQEHWPQNLRPLYARLASILKRWNALERLDLETVVKLLRDLSGDLEEGEVKKSSAPGRLHVWLEDALGVPDVDWEQVQDRKKKKKKERDRRRVFEEWEEFKARAKEDYEKRQAGEQVSLHGSVLYGDNGFYHDALYIPLLSYVHPEWMHPRLPCTMLNYFWGKEYRPEEAYRELVRSEGLDPEVLRSVNTEEMKKYNDQIAEQAKRAES